MRIRLWNSFASNNSGSYTIVGFFAEAERAQAIAELLRPVLAEHSAWRKQAGAAGEAPLHRFMRKQGLRLDDDQVGLTDDWPQWGPPPEVVAINQQVLVHCDYTVTMPRFLGELFYARDGRVEVEVNHGHHATVVIFELYVPWGGPREAVPAQLARALERLLEGPIAEFADHRVPPAWASSGFGPMLQLGVVFQNLVEGVRAVQESLAAAPVRTRIRVFEAPRESGDPLEFLRGERRAVPGECTVILWKPGPDRASTLKAIRAVTGTSLRSALAAVDSLPAELLVGVNRHDAEQAVEQLSNVGADAELLTPDDRRPR